jgi:hypothetical protein
MLRPRVVFLGTRGALNPERYQAAVLVESAGTRVLLDTGGGLGRVRRPACVNSPSSTCRAGRVRTGAGGRIRTCKSFRTVPFKGIAFSSFATPAIT